MKYNYRGLEVCKYNLTDDCLFTAHKSEFKGRCCIKCLKVKNENYYKVHQTHLIEKAKVRFLTNYVHKKTQLNIETDENI